MFVIKRDGSREAFALNKIQRLSEFACKGLDVSQSELELAITTKFFDGIRTADIHDAQIISAGALISRTRPDYTFVAARLLLMKLYKEVSGTTEYPTLREYIERAIAHERVDPRLGLFDLDALDDALVTDRDFQFGYLGLQTVADRYLIRETQRPGEKQARIIEMPQHFFMRVAMGLALRNVQVDGQAPTHSDVTRDAIDFYNVLSTFDFMSSTPTLFNSGTLHPQMSSCYGNTVADSLVESLSEENNLASIYGTIAECASLSKWAGGIGTDWTRVRGNGDVIKGTNGRSAGIVPYLKVYNDTAVAVNQGGKRMGSFSPYLETWHPDFMAFCEIKKNSGDERRRAHDVFPAAWISDLFMKRVAQNDPSVMWSFFSPNLYPELHELFGPAFEARYEELEREGKYVEQLPVLQVWQKIITMLWETGHPWLTFKDTCNLRNPQQHVGVIHNSNLCTEITLNNSDDETFVCNLGSVNLANHIADGSFDTEKLRRTVRTAMRMLDNVVDINFYPSPRAERANLRHRPVGLGVMGLSDALAKLSIDWESSENIAFQNHLFEHLSFYAIEASSDMAVGRGAYETFEGSLWSRGILPVHTAIYHPRALTFDWKWLAEKVQRDGMRNSNCMAIAPTATISNIVGVTPSIEPPYELEYTKSNLSGTFKVIASSALHDFPVKHAFEIAPEWVIEAASVRQRWIDQSQSVNIFVPADIRGRELASLYHNAWASGLKTTYYLRHKIVEAAEGLETVETPAEEPEVIGGACAISDPGCEACQ